MDERSCPGKVCPREFKVPVYPMPEPLSDRLKEKLQGAKIVRYDKDRELVLAWYGGIGISVYSLDGLAVAHWVVDPVLVVSSMENHIAGIEEYVFVTS